MSAMLRNRRLAVKASPGAMGQQDSCTAKRSRDLLRMSERAPSRNYGVDDEVRGGCALGLTLAEVEIPRREAPGDVIERHGVVGVDGEYRVGAGLAGSV